MDWTRPIDAYCERLGPGLWAEPLNTVTNAAFLVAAALAFAEWRRAGGRDLPSLVLIALIAVIGVGSALFHTVANVWNRHTVANVWSSLADVIPIALFVHAYVVLALRRFLGFGWIATALAFAGFLLLEAAAATALGSFIGSSAAYIPPLIALLATGAELRRRGHPAADAILLATVVFAISLTLRTMDGPVCAILPMGSHMVWHLLNAVTLWLLIVTALRRA